MTRLITAPADSISGRRAWNDKYSEAEYMRRVAKRFWAKVDKRGPDDCWPWTAAGDEKGYGRFGIKIGAFHCTVVASRVAWMLANNKPFPPTEMFVCHHCDNPPCCNPAHLFLGTTADNMQDCSAKGRHWNGSKTHCPRGHEYTPENIRRTTKNGRACVACDRLHTISRWGGAAA